MRRSIENIKYQKKLFSGVLLVFTLLLLGFSNSISNALFFVPALLGSFAFFSTMFSWGKGVTKINIIEMLFFGLILLSFKQSCIPEKTIKYSFTLVSIALLAYYYTRNNPAEVFIELLRKSMIVLLIINIFFIIMFPSIGIEHTEMGTYRWGGFSGAQGLAQLCGILFIVEYYNPKTSSYKWLVLVLSAFTIYKTNSVGFIASIFICIGLIWFVKSTFWKYKIIVFSGVSLFALFLITYWNELILISGRDLTLSGRTIIWGIALEAISNKFFLGYGIEGFWHPDSKFAQVNFNIMGHFVPNSHNGYFEILLDLGIVGLILYLLVIRYDIKVLFNKIKTTKVALTLFALYIYILSTNISHVNIINVNAGFILLHILHGYSKKYNKMAIRK